MDGNTANPEQAVCSCPRAQDLNVDVLPIPGTKTLSHALDNIASAQVTLAPEDMELLESIAELSSGNRESDAYMEAALEGTTERSGGAPKL